MWLSFLFGAKSKKMTHGKIWQDEGVFVDRVIISIWYFKLWVANLGSFTQWADLTIKFLLFKVNQNLGKKKK